MNKTSITSTVNFDKDGVHYGNLKLPFSDDDCVWGNIMIPMTNIRNGSGAIALCTEGNHGDELGGPIALYDLANNLKSDIFCGRVIIVPALNFPAISGGTLTSPIDRHNLNRVFPGCSDGIPT